MPFLLLVAACSGSAEQGAGADDGSHAAARRAIADVEAARAEAAQPPPRPEAPPAG